MHLRTVWGGGEAGEKGRDGLDGEEARWGPVWAAELTVLAAPWDVGHEDTSGFRQEGDGETAGERRGVVMEMHTA